MTFNQKRFIYCTQCLTVFWSFLSVDFPLYCDSCEESTKHAVCAPDKSLTEVDVEGV